MDLLPGLKVNEMVTIKVCSFPVCFLKEVVIRQHQEEGTQSHAFAKVPQRGEREDGHCYLWNTLSVLGLL